MGSTLHRMLLWSGGLSLLGSFISFLYKQWNFSWELYLLGIVLPVLLTLLAIASNFETGTYLDLVCKFKRPTKILIMVLCVLLILFQFVGISLGIKFTMENGLSRIPFELLGYFFLVGFIYTFRLLYEITAPNYSQLL